MNIASPGQPPVNNKTSFEIPNPFAAVRDRWLDAGNSAKQSFSRSGDSFKKGDLYNGLVNGGLGFGSLAEPIFGVTNITGALNNAFEKNQSTLNNSNQ